MAEENQKPNEEITLEGDFLSVYANLCGVSCTPEEVVLDFAQRQPNEPLIGARVVRVFTSLPHAKRLVTVLAQSLLDHEVAFGPIQTNVESRLTEEGRKRYAVEKNTSESEDISSE